MTSLCVQPFDFVVGQPVSEVGVKKINDSANGLFSGQSGVKPPPALSTAVIGMKAGGKVRVSLPNATMIKVMQPSLLKQFIVECVVNHLWPAAHCKRTA